MSRVLELLGYQPKTRKGHQLRGPCPIHGSSNPQSDIFAAHLGKQVYDRHHCKSGGDQLKLWQAIQKQPLYWATLKLCRAAQIEPPWLNPNRLSSCKSQPPAHLATAEPATQNAAIRFPFQPRTTACPQTSVQLCIVHMVRAALRYVSNDDSQAVVADLKKIYQAAAAIEAEQALDNFAHAWDDKYPTISRVWRAKWADIVTLFDFPYPIRKAIYTTNAIALSESHHGLRARART